MKHKILKKGQFLQNAFVREETENLTFDLTHFMMYEFKNLNPDTACLKNKWRLIN